MISEGDKDKKKIDRETGNKGNKRGEKAVRWRSTNIDKGIERKKEK